MIIRIMIDPAAKARRIQQIYITYNLTTFIHPAKSRQENALKFTCEKTAHFRYLQVGHIFARFC